MNEIQSTEIESERGVYARYEGRWHGPYDSQEQAEKAIRDAYRLPASWPVETITEGATTALTDWRNAGADAERDAALARGRQMSQPPPEYFRHTEEAS